MLEQGRNMCQPFLSVSHVPKLRAPHRVTLCYCGSWRKERILDEGDDAVSNSGHCR